MPTKIAITGGAGRMGSMLREVIGNDQEAELVAVLEAPGNPALGTKVSDTVEITASVPDNVEVDVLIDFSLPVALETVLKVATDKKCALAIATTGFNDEQLAKIKSASQIVPVCLAPNMSIGVNLFMRFAAQIAGSLGPGYDIEIIEAHHRHKKDAPSGTALKTAEKVATALNRNLKEVGIQGRSGEVGARPADEIAIHAVRGGDIVGEHTVLFCATGERIELSSKVTSRLCFANGAVKAAKALAKKQAGYYDIDALLFG